MESNYENLMCLAGEISDTLRKMTAAKIAADLMMKEQISREEAVKEAKAIVNLCK
jgi:hypothetical protein